MIAHSISTPARRQKAAHLCGNSAKSVELSGCCGFHVFLIRLHAVSLRVLPCHHRICKHLLTTTPGSSGPPLG